VAAPLWIARNGPGCIRARLSDRTRRAHQSGAATPQSKLALRLFQSFGMNDMARWKRALLDGDEFVNVSV